uniref:Uncharacterized protein n=1 Tax=Populus trichocarpa TaxID=3694 RepID=A0A2K1ZTQ5_POPTR
MCHRGSISTIFYFPLKIAKSDEMDPLIYGEGPFKGKVGPPQHGLKTLLDLTSRIFVCCLDFSGSSHSHLFLCAFWNAA